MEVSGCALATHEVGRGAVAGDGNVAKAIAACTSAQVSLSALDQPTIAILAWRRVEWVQGF